MNVFQNTYFGFTDNMKPMQKARVEKTLDVLMRHDGKVLHEKEWVLDRLIEGYTPSIEKNYSYYSAKIDDYTKPRTLYKMQLEGNQEFYEVSKTVHDFAVFLIEVGLNNMENAVRYAEEEYKTQSVLKEEQERIKSKIEAEEKERLEKEKTESEKRINTKIDVWKKESEKHFTIEVQKIVDAAIYNNLNMLDYDFQEGEKEQYKQEFNEKFIIEFGNIGYIMNNAQYLFSSEVSDILHNNINKEIYSNLFKIEAGDHYNTINAKIKAFYNSDNKQTA